MRESGRYLLVGREGAARPDPAQAAWLYAQMVRWGQTAMQAGRAQDRHGRSSGRTSTTPPWAIRAKPGGASDAIGAFAGPAFDPGDIAGHLAAFKIGHWKP